MSHLALRLATVLAFLLSSTTDAETATLSGTVQRQGGAPLAEAEVELLPLVSSFELQAALLEAREPFVAQTSATADGAGRFRINVPHGTWQVRVQAPGFVPMVYPLLPLANAVELPLVTLRPAAETEVVVRDAQGRSVPGAGVYARGAQRDLWREGQEAPWGAAPRLGWTDTEGRLVLSRARGERLEVWVNRSGLSTATQGSGASRIEVHLEPAPAAEGRLEVREADGSPAAGVLITSRQSGWPLGRTDGAGMLVLPRPVTPLGVRLLTADGRIHKDTWEPSAPHLTLTMPAEITVTGRVRSADGEALPGALVWPGADPGNSVLADGEGRYLLRTAAAGSLMIQAHAGGFVPRSRRAALEDTLPSSFDLVLQPTVPLRGRVVDGDGKAVGGAQLKAVARGERPPAIRPDRADDRTHSDAAGRFAFDSLVPTTPYTVVAMAPGFGASEQLFMPSPTGPDGDLEIVLHRGRLAGGRILDFEERPLTGIEVRVIAEGAAPDSALVTTSDETGLFEVRGTLAPRLDIEAHGGGFAPLRVRGVQVAPGNQPVDLGTLYLEPGLRVDGRVTDSSGEPIVGASIWITDATKSAVLATAPDDEPDASTGNRGDFRLEGLEKGRAVDLYADGEGFLLTSVHAIEPPVDERLAIVLKPASQIHGEILNENGKPLASAVISLYPKASESADAPGPESSLVVNSDSRGRFTFDDVAPGSFEIEAFAEGFQPSPLRPLEVVEGQEVPELSFVLARGAVLEGRITDADFEPIAGAQVAVGKPTALSDADGNYRVAGIPPGLQYVTVHRQGYSPRSRKIEIEGAAAVADFVLPGGHRITGVAIDGSGLPLAGVEIELEPIAATPELHQTLSVESGTFELEPVADGTYRVRAERQGYVAAEEQTVRVAGASVEDLEIHLMTGTRLEGQILGLDFEELSRVEVRAEAPGHSLSGEIDFDGRYRIDDLAATDWTVRAMLDGGRRETRARLAVESGVAVVHRDLEFGGGVTLSGLVLHGDEALAEAEIEIRGHDVSIQRSVTTDFEGRFQLADLDPGHYRLSLSSRHQGLVHNRDLPLHHDRDVLIEIDTAAIAGVVVDAKSGAGLADAPVSMLEILADGREGSKIIVATDAAGRFSYDRLTAGRYRLSVSHNGYQPTERQIEVTPGAVTEGVQLALDRAAGLEVAVQLASGGEPRFITVWGRDPSGRTFAETRPSDRGITQFATLPAGQWSLVVGAEGGGAVDRYVEVPDDPLAVILPDAGRLQVRVPALVEADTPAVLSVFNETGRPFRHLAWGGELQQSWPVVGGRATVEGIPSGVWTLEVYTAEGATYSGQAATTGGPDIEVNLD